MACMRGRVDPFLRGYSFPRRGELCEMKREICKTRLYKRLLFLISIDNMSIKVYIEVLKIILTRFHEYFFLFFFFFYTYKNKEEKNVRAERVKNIIGESPRGRGAPVNFVLGCVMAV